VQKVQLKYDTIGHKNQRIELSSDDIFFQKLVREVRAETLCRWRMRSVLWNHKRRFQRRTLFNLLGINSSLTECRWRLDSTQAWETLQRWAWPRSFYHENATGHNFWCGDLGSRCLSELRSYNRLSVSTPTPAGNARARGRISRAFAFTRESGFPGVVCPLRRRAKGREGGGGKEIVSATFMNFWCIAAVFGARNDFEKTLFDIMQSGDIFREMFRRQAILSPGIENRRRASLSFFLPLPFFHFPTRYNGNKSLRERCFIGV